MALRRPLASSERKRERLRPESAAEACWETRFRNCTTAVQAAVSVVRNAKSASSLGRKSVFFCMARHLETQFKEAVSVRFKMLESFDSSVVRVCVVDLSISRRMVRFGVQRGRRMVVEVC